MRKLLSGFAVLALALPLAAQDYPQTIVPVGDSPLVAAAKAAKKDKKPSKTPIIITNDNLVKTGGHITTTKTNNPLPAAPKEAVTAPTLQELADIALKAKAEADAKLKKEADAKAAKAQQARRAGEDYLGESIEPANDDPAAQEHAMSQATSKQPQSATSKQPQSSKSSTPPQP